MNRRSFLKLSALGIGGLMLGTVVSAKPPPEKKELECGWIYLTATYYYEWDHKTPEKKKEYPIIHYMRPVNTKIIPMNRMKHIGFHPQRYSRAS